MMSGVASLVLGVVAIAAAIFGRDFYAADVISGTSFKQKSSRWSGRLVFTVVGLAFIAAGIKMLTE
jgi:hypothetical protein